MTLRIACTGSREVYDKSMVAFAYKQLGATDCTWAHGAAQGMDTAVQHFCQANGFPFIPFPADWKTHGRSAGPIRNRQMIDDFKPDLILAFPSARSIGTWDCVRYATLQNIPIRIYPVIVVPNAYRK